MQNSLEGRWWEQVNELVQQHAETIVDYVKNGIHFENACRMVLEGTTLSQGNKERIVIKAKAILQEKNNG